MFGEYLLKILSHEGGFDLYLVPLALLELSHVVSHQIVVAIRQSGNFV